MKNQRLSTKLLGATALAAGMITPAMSVSQDTLSCGTLIDDALIEECIQGNAGDLVRMPIGRQTEGEVTPVLNDAGFSISIDGETVDSDPTIEDQVRVVDLALDRSNIKVTFDGFDPLTRLAVETTGAPRAYSAGQTVTLKSESNYPAFIERAEFRVIDRGAVGGQRLLATVPVTVNGQTSLVVPEGADVVVVHRVYDARGRFDETEALPLGQADDRGLRADVEELADTSAVRNIRVTGGAVTVYAENMTAGTTLSALGATARPGNDGSAVIQRILPAGDYDVNVRVANQWQTIAQTRPIEIPGSEWFYVAVGDVTWYGVDEGGERGSTTTGRFQYYVDGTTASGIEITSSLDTGEEELDKLFSRLDEKDPRSVLDRIDPEDGYQTYGDDSDIRDDTPTSGRVYLRIAKDDNYVLWGDYQATIEGNTFLRNERSLYGLQAGAASNAATDNGEARFSAEVYGAQPDQLVGRETFRGTGGSVYFLRRQDVTPGTETLTLEIRDADTGRVVERQALVAGRDYDVNYLQGVITLTSPLTGSVNDNLIQTNPSGDQLVNLVAQYEYTPTTTDVDGFSYGGRAEAWVTDDLRLGVTATSDDTGTAEQVAQAVDLRYEFGANSFVQLDYATSDGPGYDQDFSIDGGFTIDGTPAEDGNGEAFRFAGQVDMADLGYDREGVVGAYFEQRSEGFSTLDYQVTSATGDETLYGAYARIESSENQLGWALYGDVYENDAGTTKTETGAELEGELTTRLSFTIAAEHLDETTATTDGTRLDIGGRLTYAVNDDSSIFVFGQTTASSDGLSDYDRGGVGLSYAVNDVWTVEAEVSGGTGGAAGRILALSEDEDGNSSYFGYELDADRALNAGVSRSENGGKYILGGRRQVSDSVSVFGENTYDIFDADRTLTSVYGVEYTASDFLTYDIAAEFGQVDNSDEGELMRTALSFGVRYEDASWRSTARLEFRRDDADEGSDFSDFDAIYLTTNATYAFNDERRLLFSLSAADSQTDGTSVIDGRLVDASIGYAYRPIMDERLNILARYRFLNDQFGQEIDGDATTRIQQESHVFSLEGSYDVSRDWTLGAKVGGRLSETADTTTDEWTSNDAYVAVFNARYHLVHNWDVLLEARHLELPDADLSETGGLAAVYRHFGNNAKVGVGYNFSNFSDELTDLSQDDQGVFINIIAKF